MINNFKPIISISSLIRNSYFIILIISAFTLIPYVDSYYYWLLGKNLQLSYVDGPPLIAYIIRIATTIFGDTTFAINIVGTIITIISFWFVVQISKSLMLTKDIISDKYASLIGILWLTNYSIVAHRMISFVTYDGLINLFELAVISSILQYIKDKKNIQIYAAGIFSGLALLSKYSAIVSLTIILCYFLYYTELRIIFRKIHIYLAMLISILIFSPVLVWNYLHNGNHLYFNLLSINIINQPKNKFYIVSCGSLNQAF